MTLPLGFPGYDGIRRHGPLGRVILGLGHLDHTQKMASYVSGTHKLHQFLAGEPTVHQEVFEPYSFKDSAFDHTDEIVHLALEVFLRPLCGAAVRIALLAVSGIQLLLRLALRFGRFLHHFTLECEVHEGLRLSIREQEEQSFVAKDACMFHMGEDTDNEFILAAGFRNVGVIRNQAAGFRAFDGVASHRDSAQEPAVEAVHDLPPVDVRVGEEHVEHIFLAGEQLTKDATGEVETIFDGEEREQDHQRKDLACRELAVRGLGKVHLPVVKRDMRLYVHDSLNRLRIVTFSKKAVEFRDNMPIFVHAKGCYICLFGNTNIVTISEICNISQKYQP